MASDDRDGDRPRRGEAEPPGSLANVTPPKAPMLDHSFTLQVVMELQGSVGELKQAVGSIEGQLAKGADRTESIGRATAEIKDQLAKLAPKIDDLAGFVRHGVPNLCSKTDLTALKTDMTTLKADMVLQIEKRPTRRQAIADIILIVGAIAGAITLGTRLVH